MLKGGFRQVRALAHVDPAAGIAGSASPEETVVSQEEVGTDLLETAQSLWRMGSQGKAEWTLSARRFAPLETRALRGIHPL